MRLLAQNAKILRRGWRYGAVASQHPSFAKRKPLSGSYAAHLRTVETCRRKLDVEQRIQSFSGVCG